MDRDSRNNEVQERDYPHFEEGEEISFPSWRIVISLYTLGAFVSLILAFNPSLDALQTTNCLIISWVLALGALGMSVFCESPQVNDIE